MNVARKQTHLPVRGSAAAMAENPTERHELSQRIAALKELTAQQLRDEWRRLYRGQPPRLSRDLLIRTVAYRMQELAYGGLMLESVPLQSCTMTLRSSCCSTATASQAQLANPSQSA
jgi:hypothetical protein